VVKTLFLPGAGGSAGFWQPAAALAGLAGEHLSWPGLGNEPAHPGIQGIDDLVSLVLAKMESPVNIVAQSMGGYIAVRAALAAPDKIHRLVLTATSGGLDMPGLGAADWSGMYFAAYPGAARWIADRTHDLSAQIPTIQAETLLLWGDADPISPVAVGARLHALLPRATLHVIPNADHDLAQTHAPEVAALLRAFLTPTPDRPATAAP
jgi:pimeloyl-ACP methyl ester carboxylesterase